MVEALDDADCSTYPLLYSGICSSIRSLFKFMRISRRLFSVGMLSSKNSLVPSSIRRIAPVSDRDSRWFSSGPTLLNTRSVPFERRISESDSPSVLMVISARLESKNLISPEAFPPIIATPVLSDLNALIHVPSVLAVNEISPSHSIITVFNFAPPFSDS